MASDLMDRAILAKESSLHLDAGHKKGMVHKEMRHRRGRRALYVLILTFSNCLSQRIDATVSNTKSTVIAALTSGSY